MSIVVVIAVLRNIFCDGFAYQGLARQEPCQKFSIHELTQGFDRGKRRGTSPGRYLTGIHPI